MVFRNELKHVISPADRVAICANLAAVAQRDPHAGPDGSYLVRSLYVDDLSDSALREKLDGVDSRDKFRIRIYNHSTQRITLECKRKEHGKTLKTSCPLTREQLQQLIQGKPLTNMEELTPLQRKLTLHMRTSLLRPVVIVDYDRIPYIYKNGNVRVTFDINMASSASFSEFLSPSLPKRPIMPAGQYLMEVKFDEYLPDFIYRSLNLGRLQQTAYSKYYLCRKHALKK